MWNPTVARSKVAIAPSLLLLLLIGSFFQIPHSISAQQEPAKKSSGKSTTKQTPATGAPEKTEASRAQTKIASYEQLVKAYEAQKIPITKNEKSKSLLFTTRKGDFSGVMVVKWDDVNGVLHLVQTMPLKVDKEKTDLYLNAAQTLNHGFLFPGIGLNLDNGNAYYRLSIPIFPKGFLYDYEVGTYSRFALTKASEFMPTLTQVLNGKITTDEVLLHHQKRLRELAAKNVPVKLAGRYSRKIEDVDWMLDFSEPGIVKVIRDGKVGVTSDYQVRGNAYRFDDREGPLASKSPGIYLAFLSNGKLSFRLERDEAKERTKMLTGGVWVLQKD